MKNMILIVASLMTFGTFAAFEEKTADFDPASDLAASEALVTSLNLTNVWDMTALDAQTIPYSAVGWDLTELVNTRTVSVSYVPEGEIDVVTVKSGLTGKGSFVWQPANVSKKVYVMTHNVYSGSSIVSDEKLTATYSFVNCEMQASEADVLLALMASGHACTFTNDETHPWQPIDDAGDGIACKANTETELSFVFEGAGTFALDYKYDGGTLTMLVDGVGQTISSSADWKALTLNFSANVQHTVVFSCTSTDSSVAALKGCHWQERASETWNEPSAAAQVDLREGFRVVKKFEQLYPFTYSITNFTGLSGVTDQSEVRVRVVQCAGEGTDIAAWTNEVAGTEKVLTTEEDEGTTAWEGRNGVWKAEFGVFTGAKTNHLENAWFDMRKFGIGFLLILK